MKNVYDLLKLSSAEMAAYWRDDSHKIHRQQPMVWMSAPRPPAATSEDPIVRAAVDGDVRWTNPLSPMVPRSFDDEVASVGEEERWINPLNPLLPESFDDERLFS